MPVIAAIGAGVTALGGAGAVVGAGASIAGGMLTANAQKSASNASAAAYQAATDKQLAVQQAALARAQKNNQPFMDTGYTALDALGTKLLQPATTTDYGGYLSQYGDVAQFANDAVAQGFTPEGWAGGKIDTPEEAAAYHYQTYGKTEGRTAPTVTQNPGPQISDAQAPTYQKAPVFNAPAAPNVGEEAFKNSGYYQLGLKTGMNNLNANFGARGLLKSGSAIEGATQFGQENFAKNYGDFYQQQMDLYKAQLAQFNADRSAGLNQLNNENNFAQSNYQYDRNADTADYNTNTQNLYNLANMGQTAAGNVTAANQNYASRASGIYGDQADATAANAYANAGTTTDLTSSVVGQVKNLFANYGGVATTGRTTPIAPGWGNNGNIFTQGAYY